jgi:phosphoribosylglycinamide formyltransferase-1
MSNHTVKIYTPKKGMPMSVIFFASNSATNLRSVHRLSQKYPKAISVDLVVTDRKGIGAIEYATKNKIPVITQNFFEMCGSHPNTSKSSVQDKKYHACSIRFHNLMLKQIKEFETKRGYKFDLAVLNYYRWIHGDLLKYFSRRMINQHPADLSVMSEDKKTRKYIGIDPAYLSILDGCKRTRTSTILVRSGHDAGEILCQGPWCRYTGSHPVTKERAAKHESKQEKISDIPALEFAVKAISKGKYSIGKAQHYDGTHVLYFNGKKLPYQGVELSH